MAAFSARFSIEKAAISIEIRSKTDLLWLSGSVLHLYGALPQVTLTEPADLLRCNHEQSLNVLNACAWK